MQPKFRYSRRNLLFFLFFVQVLFSVGFATPVKAFNEKKTALASTSGVMSIQLPLDGVVLSEETRDKKTFQVAKIVIKANPEVVYKLFTDYENAPSVFSYLKGCRIISTKPNKQVWFAAVAAGGLLKIEYVLEFKEYPTQLVEWHRVSGAFKANEGYWKFEPVNNGKSTLITYSKFVDAGFPFPQFLVKKELRDNMPKILTELKKGVETRS